MTMTLLNTVAARLQGWFILLQVFIACLWPFSNPRYGHRRIFLVQSKWPMKQFEPYHGWMLALAIAIDSWKAWKNGRFKEEMQIRAFLKNSRICPRPSSPECKVDLIVRQKKTGFTSHISTTGNLPVQTTRYLVGRFVPHACEVVKVRIGWPSIENSLKFEVVGFEPDQHLDDFRTYGEALAFAETYIATAKDAPPLYKEDGGAQHLIRYRPFLGASRQFNRHCEDYPIPAELLAD